MPFRFSSIPTLNLTHPPLHCRHITRPRIMVLHNVITKIAYSTGKASHSIPPYSSYLVRFGGAGECVWARGWGGFGWSVWCSIVWPRCDPFLVYGSEDDADRIACLAGSRRNASACAKGSTALTESPSEIGPLATKRTCVCRSCQTARICCRTT